MTLISVKIISWLDNFHNCSNQADKVYVTVKQINIK